MALSKLGYHEFCARWIPKCSQLRTKRREQLRFDFSEQYHKDGDEVLNRIVWVTSDETWVSFANVETKVQSKR
jgi:predicted NAD/FAD-dependent oxidoreductase